MDDSRYQANSRQHSKTGCHDDRTEDKKTRNRRIPFGMDSFDADAQELFGNNVRVSMSFMDGSAIPPQSDHPEKAMPDEASAIALRLKQLGQDITSNTADQLELLVRFDELEGWTSTGARHCVAWMNLEMGISLQQGWEYLRVGRKLRTLPITRALFRAGNLTWSIVRLISRVADNKTEALLCHTALDASVSEVERMCNDYRWQQDADENGTEAENERSLKQIDARFLTWKTVSNGNTLINLSLPPEVGQAFLNCVEQSLAQLEESDASMPQRRADAAVLMAENSLQNAGREMATADRYQVIVSVDASELRQSSQSEQHQETSATFTPEKHATIQGTGSIATETARRIACDCSVSTLTLSYMRVDTALNG